MPTINIVRDGSVMHTMTSVMACSRTDTMDGEMTLSFTSTSRRIGGVRCGDIAELDGEPYKIVRISKSYSGGSGVYAISCEHVSYGLADVTFDQAETLLDTPRALLDRILTDTGFYPGDVAVTGAEYFIVDLDGMSGDCDVAAAFGGADAFRELVTAISLEQTTLCVTICGKTYKADNVSVVVGGITFSVTAQGVKYDYILLLDGDAVTMTLTTEYAETQDSAEAEPGQYAMTITEGMSAREAVARLAAGTGLEVVYTGYSVSLVYHRGGNRLELPYDEMVTGISVTEEARATVQSYELTLRRPRVIRLGDVVHLTFDPMEIDVTDRVTAVTINPFVTLQVAVTLGGYVPDIITEEVMEASRTVKLGESYYGNTISKQDGFVSVLKQDGQDRSRVTVNGSTFRLEKYNVLLDEWESCIYFDTVTDEYVFDKDIKFNGNLISEKTIQIHALAANLQDAVEAGEKVADGTYEGGTFIDGTSIFAPQIYADEFIVQPQNGTSGSGTTMSGGYTLRGYYGNTLYDMLNISYFKGDAPCVRFESAANAYASWDFGRTVYSGYLDLQDAIMDKPAVSNQTYGSTLPSDGVQGQLFFLIE